jgi:hypothetical protein
VSRLTRTEANLAVGLVVGALVIRGAAVPPGRELAELLALSAASGPLTLGDAPPWDALLWAWVQLLEAGSARVLSGLLAALQVGAVFLTARLLLPVGLSVVVALLVLLTPLTLGSSQDIRPDALLGLLATASWGIWLAGWDRGPRGAAHAAAVLLTAAVSPWGALAVLPQAILRPRWRWIPLATVCLAVVLSQAGPAHSPRLLSAQLLSFALDEPITLAIVGLLAAAVFAAPQRHSAALAGWLVVPLLAGTALGLEPRSAAVCLPALWLLAGQGLSGLPLGRRAGLSGLLLLLGGLALSHRVAHPPSRPDTDALAAALPALEADDVILAAPPEAWSLVLSRSVDGGISDADSALQLAAAHRGRRLLWLLGERSAHDATAAVLRESVLLQRIAAGGGEALLLCAGCARADPAAAIFDPAGERLDDTLALYTNAAVVLPDLVAGPGRYAVDVVAWGTAAGGVPAKLEITLEGGEPVGDRVWSLPPRPAARRVLFEVTRPGAVILRFLNDGTSGAEDRNVFIERVTLSAQP